MTTETRTNGVTPVGSDIHDMLGEINQQVMKQAVGLSRGRQQRLSETIFALYRALLDVAERPDEPIDCEAVTFHRRWQSGMTSYLYAAIKCTDGYWYITGSDKRYTWESLLDFIGDEIKSLKYLQECSREDESSGADG